MIDKKETAIIDLSAIYWRNWHATEAEEVSSAKRKTLSFVRNLYGQYDEIIVALDAPPYKRCDAYPEYKANRPERNQAAVNELKQAIEDILNDGWKVAKCQGYEADDVIATLVKQRGECDVYGTDKDLLQCTDLIDIFASKEKTPENTLKVSREKVVDYLTLIGDASDNIKGVKLIGPKKAVDMLEKYGTIKGIYDALLSKPEDFTPATTQNLQDAMEWIDTTRSIIQLSDNLELDIEQREPKKVEYKEMEEEKETAIETVKEEKPVAIQISHEQMSFKQSLEPVGMSELWRISTAFINSKLYSKFPTAEAIMVTIMRGRSLGLDATTSLDGINVIQGKPTMAASLMLALVLSSPQCEYMVCKEMSPEACTWIAKRKGAPIEIERTFTIQDAAKMGLTGKDNWKKQPDVMLQWRCAAALIRQLFPDVVNGLYATEEMQ